MAGRLGGFASPAAAAAQDSSPIEKGLAVHAGADVRQRRHIRSPSQRLKSVQVRPITPNEGVDFARHILTLAGDREYCPSTEFK